MNSAALTINYASVCLFLMKEGVEKLITSVSNLYWYMGFMEVGS